MSTFERHPTQLSEVVQHDRMFAHDADGKAISRTRTCECGRSFPQRLLSERFLAIVERQGKRAFDLFTKQVPGFYVPVHCPPCERVDLRRGLELEQARSLPDHYRDKDDAAD